MVIGAQIVGTEFQYKQVGEVAQLRRFLPARVVVEEAQLSNTPSFGRSDVVPFANGPVAQPVRVVIPVCVTRALIQSDQYSPVRDRLLRRFLLVDA